ncbi:unnamed protein product [Toxocara canis]|uniref:G-protein alpha subunit n=1 Tax=Toxocara canis TaxID=6265 RepID=A0A183TZA9_TOXCA|nr:unnamed protein product [Toxocara canis]
MGAVCCRSEVFAANNEPQEEELIRFFMVGMGGAGKSTVIRQLMKLCIECPQSYKMYDSEWNEKQSVHSEADLRKWKLIIQHNILESFCKTIQQCRLFGISFPDEQKKIVDEIEKLCGDVRTLHLRKQEWTSAFNEQLGNKLVTLIDNDKVSQSFQCHMITKGTGELCHFNLDPLRRTLLRSHEFSADCRLSDGAPHFLNRDKILSYSRDDTLPTEEDIVHARDPTSGLNYYHFRVHKMRIELHDMGGQMVERQKVLDFLTHWISDSKPNYRNFVLYVTSMAEYNVLHPDNPQYTLLDESAAFMKMILNLSQVQECGFLIFFNKSDIFEERVSDPMLKPDFRKFLGRFIKEGDLKKYEQGNVVKVEVLRKAIASKFADTVNSVVVKRRAPVYHR